MAEDRNGFWLLAAGALAFAAAFLLGMEWLNLDQTQTMFDPPVLVGLCTILFGLPYAVRELGARKTNWGLIAFLLLLIPLFHFVAVNIFVYVSSQLGEATALAAESGEMAESAQAAPTNPALLIGLAAGFAGAVGPLLVLGLLRWLRAPGASPMLFMAALVTLAWWGGMGLRQAVGDGSADLSPYDLAVIVFLPWQIILAFFLSRLLRQSPPRDAPAPAP